MKDKLTGKINNETLITRIKHLVVCWLPSATARIKSSSNLTGKDLEMPNVSYKRPMSKAKITKKSSSVPLKQIVKQNERDRNYLWTILIFLFTFLLYSNTLQHKFVLDDFGALADNWIIKKGISGIPIILTTSYRYGIHMLTDNLYRPLSQVMFAIEWQMILRGNSKETHYNFA